jgi:hypothetical protein
MEKLTVHEVYISFVLEFIFKTSVIDLKIWFMTDWFRGFSPQANYTDRATAACQRSYCQLFRVDGVALSAQRIPTAFNLVSLDPKIRFIVKTILLSVYGKSIVDYVFVSTQTLLHTVRFVFVFFMLLWSLCYSLLKRDSMSYLFIVFV